MVKKIVKRDISLKSDPEYWQALGEFIEEFAMVEAVIFNLLIYYTKIDHKIGCAVFSEKRMDACIKMIRRLMEVVSPGKDREQELGEVFQQLHHILNVRNLLAHQSSFITSDMGRIVSTISRAHTIDSIKERRVDTDILKAMTADLKKIGMHFVMLIVSKASFNLRAVDAPVLNEPWLYKPS